MKDCDLLWLAVFEQLERLRRQIAHRTMPVTHHRARFNQPGRNANRLLSHRHQPDREECPAHRAFHCPPPAPAIQRLVVIAGLDCCAWASTFAGDVSVSVDQPESFSTGTTKWAAHHARRLPVKEV